ncbi:hypothetical protein RJT34_06228 [Clitoria ternatea]|uniref:Uncharacterized protein n=1 Tax=Clitoria ternatea TaxID=43366 RepID=A0AAN9K377_CLITE
MEPDYRCCFCFSSKKSLEWGKNDEMLSDMSTFSVKEQERRLKKALQEEKRVSKEAERVVQWVKQESARIDDSVIKSVLSHDQKQAPLQ